MITSAMTTTDALRGATARLGAIQAEIVALASRVDGEWRRELIALRRRLQQEITGISQLVETLSADGSDMKRLRAALGRMRSNVALHQANWPAVAIERDDADYKASVQEVRAASRDFIALVAMLPPNLGTA